MGPTTKTRIAVRGYEMDSRGVVSAESLARYLEHARWLTFDPEDGLGLHRFFGSGVVRAQRMDVLAKTTFPDELEVTTWIGRVGRTSFDFVHRVERVGDGALVALNATTIVSLRDGKPAPLPEEAKELLVQDEGPSAPPLAAEPPAEAWSTELLPRPSDQDVLQHVNQARYVAFAEDVGRLAAREGALGDDAVPDAAAAEVAVGYERESRAGERLRAKCWPLEGGAYGVVIERADDGAAVTRVRIAPAR